MATTVDATLNGKTIARVITCFLDPSVLVLLLSHLRTCRLGELHNKLFFINFSAEKVYKRSPVGISLSKLLEDRFKYSRYTSFSNKTGITLAKVLLDKSKLFKLIKSLND